MSTIEKLYNEWQAVQPLTEILQRRMNQSFMIDFNYNSNHLEGNTLTYGQTKLLLMFGKVQGSALMRDYEEMKAHNVGLEMTKAEALDRERPLAESFIRELNRTILAGDFYKTSADGEYRYKIHTGVYKTRPNSVITATGELFDYASPEETPALMADLVGWYNGEERRGELSPIELAVLFHYRYIRVHPFEDGNGRIARLLVNYILYRHGYPMIVIPSADRRNYLDVLGQCDAIIGKNPFDGANATVEQIKLFVDYISTFVEKKLTFAIRLANGEIRDISETDKKDQEAVSTGEKVTERVTENQRTILHSIAQNPHITSKELSVIVGITPEKIRANIAKLKHRGLVERIGGDKSGRWRIKD
jgi:Fic family protein